MTTSPTPDTPGVGMPVPPGPAGPIGMPAAGGGEQPGPARPTVTVGQYATYAEAQQAVDFLSDSQFPVQHSAIIGTDLRLVENVIGRLTVGRAALAGAGSGAWFGLFLGLLFGLFTNANWFAVVIAAVLIGAAWGAGFGALAHALTGGRRDFTSRSTLQAARYAVVVDAEYADQARHLLIQLNWRASGAQ